MEVSLKFTAHAGTMRSALRATQSTRSLNCHYANLRLSRSRFLHSTAPGCATPLPHGTIPGPPPEAPRASVSDLQDRVARKRRQAELLQKGQQARVDAARPLTAIRKRFWNKVSVLETEEGLQVMLDSRPVRTAAQQVLTLPRSRRALALSIAMEWDQLVSAQQALKQHYVPLTSLVSRAIDIDVADRAGDATVRAAIVKMLMRYLVTDTLLCWAPERTVHDPGYESEQSGQGKLRQRQRESAESIIAYLCAHVFPGITIDPVLDEESIVPKSQSEMTLEVIQGWITGLPPFDLAALERGVLATKSLLVAVRLLIEWSQEFKHLRKVENTSQRFGIEEAAEAATLELMHQVRQWGEVEDTHDVEKEDLRRQLGSVVLLVG